MYAPNDPLSVKTLPVLNFVSRLSLRRSLALLMGLVIWFVSPAPVRALVDDRQITISSATDVSNKRQRLIQFIWGSAGFPSDKLPSSRTLDVCSLPRGNQSPANDVCGFVNNLSNLERVDEIRMAMSWDQEGLAYHFIPAERKNHRLVILHHGHACTMNDSPEFADVGFGMQRTINALLQDGYSVLAMYMPHFRPDDCWYGRLHDPMFTIPVTTGSPMKFFLEPVAVALNYLKTQSSTDNFPQYQEFDMVGLSGGGWTTTVYAAIDPTIKFSFPVAGSIPLYLRFGDSIGDLEQTLPAFYQIAGYPDLYVMGSYGSDRKQVQILNRLDDCCFGRAEHDAAATGMSYVQAMRTYEAQVRQVMFTLGFERFSGTFRLEIDDAPPGHMISHNAIVNVILSELNQGRRYIGADTSTHAFVRGMNGHLWHHGPGGWEDTGIEMVGVPAVLHGIVEGDFSNKFDVFYRDPGNRLMRASKITAEGSWRIKDMNGIIITDPVATASPTGPTGNRFDVVALGGDYTLYHWWWGPGGIINDIKSEQTSGSAMGLGTPALVTRGVSPQLDIFFRGWDRAVYHMSSSGSAPWTLDRPGGVILDFPAAVATGGNTLRVYVRGQSRQLFEASQTNGGAWEWNSLSAVTGSTGTSLSGSPSASLLYPRGVKVYMRTSAGNLSSFTLSEGAWGFLNHDGFITGSPTSTPGGAFVRGKSAGLWLFDGANWTSLGGVFD
jgi:hypothetical protein